MIQDFDVKESPPSQLEALYPNVTVVQGEVAHLDAEHKVTVVFRVTGFIQIPKCS